MKKTMMALLILGSVASAASIGYSGMDESLKTGVVMGLDWSTGENVSSLSGGTSNNGALDITNSSPPWANVETGTSWTLSFDIIGIKVDAWQSILCLASTADKANSSDVRKLQLQCNGSGDIYFYNTNGTDEGKTPEQEIFFDGTLSSDESKPSSTNMELGINKQDTLNTVYTLTFVSDADEDIKTLTAYINGSQVGQWTNWAPDGGIGGIQFGQRFGGGRGLGDNGSFTIDNVTIWDRALDSTTVSSLIVPEPTTATLSLLALAGLAARRRRR